VFKNTFAHPRVSLSAHDFSFSTLSCLKFACCASNRLIKRQQTHRSLTAIAGYNAFAIIFHQNPIGKVLNQAGQRQLLGAFDASERINKIGSRFY
jgi:hypothetical protein